MSASTPANRTALSGPVAAATAALRLAMAGCMAVMAVAVFINVVLRYGFGTGIPGSEELARLLFVWMVFIGATLAYPAGEHMVFNSVLQGLQHGRARWRWLRC
jgi:TRAP-type transport system small permease protein